MTSKRLIAYQINETIELAEWIGESKMLEKLVDKSTILKSIQFEN